MIDFTKSKQYTLSIRLSTDGFSFSIYNPIHDDSLSIIEKEIDTSLSLTANLKAVFHESDFLNHPYKRVNIMMASKRFTIAPLDLFEEGQAELLFYHNHQKRENETVLYNILRKNNIAVIFGIDKSAQTFLNEQYPEARFYSQSTPFIDYFSFPIHPAYRHHRYRLKLLPIYIPAILLHPMWIHISGLQLVRYTYDRREYCAGNDAAQQE